jgi:predicted glycosyltransferase
VRKFAPDIFIADNVPRGACGELDETLEYLYAQWAGLCMKLNLYKAYYVACELYC